MRSFTHLLLPMARNSVFSQEIIGSLETKSLVDVFLFSKRHYQSESSKKLVQIIKNDIDSIKKAGTYKEERVLTGPQEVSIDVKNSKSKTLNFCANNYLGLANDSEIVDAAISAIKSRGNGLSSVRFICGCQDIHKKLENQISEFHSREDTILYASCFDANAGIFEQILGSEDVAFSDALNHASIIDGLRLCKAAKKFRYPNKDMKELERLLAENQDARTRLIVTDGVFSMDGNIAPLPQICDLAEKYNALVFIDECHATGFFGQTGRGTEEYFGLEPGRVDIINSTLGKAMGGAMGGYTTGTKELVELLRQKSRPYLFSNSLPPSVVGSASAAFDKLLDVENIKELIEKLNKNVIHFRESMGKAGFQISGEGNHPICPVMIGDAKLASDMASAMLEEGIYVIGFSFPVVPKGKARIRVQLSAAHSRDDINRTIGAFIEVGKQHGVLKQ